MARLLPELPAYEAGGGPVIVQGVILRKQAGRTEVLLVKRTSPRAWELPGGGPDPGESYAAATAREVLEETGIVVDVAGLVRWYRRTGFRPHRSPVFVCHARAGTPRPNAESVAVAYFPVEALPLGLFPWYRPVIRDALLALPNAGTSTSDASTGANTGTSTSDASGNNEQVQHLGIQAVVLSAVIHLAELCRLLP